MKIEDIVVNAAGTGFVYGVALLIIISLGSAVVDDIMIDLVPDPAASPNERIPSLEGGETRVTQDFVSSHESIVFWVGFGFGAVLSLCQSLGVRKAYSLHDRLTEIPWLNIVLINPLIAIVSTLIWITLTDLSFFALFFEPLVWLVWAGVTAVLHVVGVPDAWPASAERAVEMYYANEFRLAFWVFYGSLILHDLGLPSIKEMYRSMQRRVKAQYLLRRRQRRVS